MQFNNDNSNNNKSERKNINTNGTQFMNSSGTLAQSTLVTKYWNSMVSLRIHPMLPADKQTEYKKFNYEESFTTSLTIEKAQTFIDIIEEALTTEKEKFFKGVPVGADSLIGLGSVANGEERMFFLGIYKSLDPDTGIPKEKMLYEFTTMRIIEDYNDETGAFTSNETKQSQLKVFKAMLKSAVEHLTNAHVHAEQVENDYQNKRQSATLNGIANKLGVETAYGNGGRRYNNNGGGYNNNNGGGFNGGGYQNEQPKIDQVAERTVSNASEISSLLG